MFSTLFHPMFSICMHLFLFLHEYSMVLSILVLIFLTTVFLLLHPSICSFSISFSFTDNLLAFCFIGFSSPVSIVCLTIFVLPTSYFPLINISSFFRITLFTFLC